MRLSGVRNFSFGDSATSNSSYEVRATGIRGWRDMGTVPTSVTALDAGGTAASVGCYVDANCTDSVFDGKCLMMGAQVGFDTAGGNVTHISSHAWARAVIGWMDYAFWDRVGGTYICTYADTPRWTGYRLGGAGVTMIGAKVYNNDQYGTDNQVSAVHCDSDSDHRIIGCRWVGADSSHRLAYDFSPNNGAFRPGYNAYARVGNVNTNTVEKWNELPQPHRTNPNGATGSYGVFHADFGRQVELDSAAPATLTVPVDRTTNSGQQVRFIQMGAGKLTIAAGPGVTIHSPDGNLSTRAQYSTITLTRLSVTADTYLAGGDLGP